MHDQSGSAWFDHSPQCDFCVKNAYRYMWGLPVIVPTCPKKFFATGPSKKYVDIVTDTVHASSSDLITWNTLVMIRLKWVSSIPREWGEITTSSLKERKARDEKPPFLPDNRRGYARVLPVALSKDGVPDHPIEGLGIYDDSESTSQFTGYVWSDWTNKTVQPMHVDKALQDLINKPARNSAGATMASSKPSNQSSATANVENKGSGVHLVSHVRSP